MGWTLARGALVPGACALVCAACAVEGDRAASVSEAATLVTSFEAESMTGSSKKITPFPDATASGRKGLVYWVAGTATKSVTLPSAAATLTVVARGDACNGAPTAVVKVDGVEVLSASIAATTWTEYTATGSFGAGAHTVEIAYPDDVSVSKTCDRNLRLDKISFYAGTTGGATTDAGTTTTDSGTTTTGTTYYVDATSGNDAADGKSEATAWRSLAKASAAPLAPGDRLLFRRDGVWTGTLTISRSGTSSAPIAVGAYGTGALPIVARGSSCVKVTGSYVSVGQLHADDASWAGFEIAGSHDRLHDAMATHNVTGVEIKSGATDNEVLHSEIVDNAKMSVLTVGGDDDSGAFGILLHGDRNEIAWNHIAGQDAFSYDYGRDGSAVEIYGGQDNRIHHNVAEQNQAFTELGDARSANNTYAYNLVRSSLATSTFLVTRGAASSFGPVLGTRAYDNTVYLTGSSSQGFVCHAGCSASILVMRNNVVQAAWKVGYADAPFDEDYDLFFQGQLQFTRGAHAIVADPKFVSPGTGDLHLQSTSPGIDTGVSGLGYTVDLDGNAVPRDGNGDGVAAVDRGAYER